jgi:acyl-CoA hydrolase
VPWWRWKPARLAYTGTTSMNIFIEVRSGPQISEAYQ